MSKKKLILQYFKEVWKSNPRGLLFSIVLSLFVAGTEGAGILLIIPMLGLLGLSETDSNNALVSKVSGFIEGTGVELNLTMVLILYVVIVGSYSIIRERQGILNMRLTIAFVNQLRLRSYRLIAHTEWSFFSGKKLSELSNHLISQIQITGRGFNQLASITTNITLLFTYLWVALSISPLLCALSIVGLGALLVVSSLFNRGSYKSGDREQNFMKKLHALIIEGLGGFKTARIYQQEDALVEDFRKTSSQLEQNIVRFAKINARSSTFLTIGGTIWIASMVLIAIKMEIDLSEMLLMALIFARLHPMALKLYKSLITINNIMPAYKAVSEFHNEAHKARKHATTAQLQDIHLKEALVLEGIHFSYGEHEVLRDFHLTLQAHTLTVIQGPSGVGKSTLVDLIIGLQQAARGTQQVDGIAITPKNVQAFQKRISYLEQIPFFFHDSIRQNLLFANDKATEAEMEDCLTKASALDFVMQLPKQLDTVVGDRGVLLSGGERQRLALARALLRKPELLLLDEATNALDQKNEEAVMRALLEMKQTMTIVLVTHKANFSTLADQVVVLEETSKSSSSGR